MSTSPSSSDTQRLLLEKALREIRRLKQQVTDLERQQHEPIAIVGLSCRFPGSNTPEAYWDTLREGRHCITDMYQQRWNMDALYDPDPDAAGKIYTRALGIVQDPEYFDAGFFGIAPREAEDIDPQHRVLLEVCHEALQRSGYSVASLAGTATGVFVGISGQDYAHLGSRLGSPAAITPWQGTGNALSAAAGRLSYLLNLRGPSMAVDTACSSSLVALHLACQSLRNGESSLAIAGGVHLIFNPATTMIFARARMLSPHGTCKTFDAEADGYVRSEGCGVLVLKRLSDALRDGDNVIALIRGSAVNQDGKSQGFTAPNEQAQEAVIRSALTQAQLLPADIAYLEAHGTGTPLGDPIELAAANNVYSEGRKTPLYVGTCKTNIGHSEAAAGMAGVIKAALALQQDYIPPHLHFTTPNPFVPWAAMKLHVPARGEAFPAGYTQRRAAVSGFGFTGTNAHVVLEAAPDKPVAYNAEVWWPALVPVSAKTPAALVQVLHSLADAVERSGIHADDQARDVCYTQSVGRDHFRYRAIVAADSGAETEKERLAAALHKQALVAGQEKQETTHPRLDFVFSAGENPDLALLADAWTHWPFLQMRLRALESDFADVTGCNLSDTLVSLRTGHVEEALQRCCAATAQFVAATVWMEMGVRPARLVGTGDGLLVAACVARVLSYRDMLRYLQAQAQKTALQTVLNETELQTPRLSLFRQGTEVRLGAEIKQPQFWNDVFAEAGETCPGNNNGNDDANGDGDDKIHALNVWPNQADGGNASWLTNSVAALYLLGIDLNWALLWQGVSARRVILPTYPFARQRFWNDALRDPALENAFPAAARDWCYELAWEQRMPVLTENRTGLWHIITDDLACGDRLAQQWRMQGETVCLWEAKVGDGQAVFSSIHGRFEGVPALLQALATINAVPAQFVLMPFVACRETLAEDDYREWSSLVLQLTQQQGECRGQLALLTRGAYSQNANGALSPLAALMAGFAKTLSLEAADVFNGHFDLDMAHETDWQWLAGLLKCSLPLVSVQVSDGAIYEQRLLRVDTQTLAFVNRPVKAQRYYVVAGGTGALGLAVARWLLGSGATHIALLSRSGRLGDDVVSLQQEAGAQGRVVRVMAVDIADAAALGHCLQALRASCPLAGVIHAAGLFDLTPISAMTPAQLFAVMDNKVKGICYLDQLTAEDALDMFVGFSSIASVWGSAGNFHYGAANQVVDAIVQRRRARGLSASVINWGPWLASGMLTEASDQMARQRGLRAMDKHLAIQVLARLLVSDRVQTVIADIDWPLLYPLLALTPAVSMVQHMAPRKTMVDLELDSQDLDFKQRWLSLQEAERPAALLDYLSQQLAKALQAEPDTIDIAQPLINMGIDSLMAVGFRQRVQQVTGLDVPVVLVLGGASLQTLAERLCATVLQSAPVPEEAVEVLLEGMI